MPSISGGRSVFVEDAAESVISADVDTNHEFRALADQHINPVLQDLDLPHQLLPAGHQHAASTQARTFIAGPGCCQGAR